MYTHFILWMLTLVNLLATIKSTWSLNTQLNLKNDYEQLYNNIVISFKEFNHFYFQMDIRMISNATLTAWPHIRIQFYGFNG